MSVGVLICMQSMLALAVGVGCLRCPCFSGRVLTLEDNELQGGIPSGMCVRYLGCAYFASEGGLFVTCLCFPPLSAVGCTGTTRRSDPLAWYALSSEFVPLNSLSSCGQFASLCCGI